MPSERPWMPTPDGDPTTTWLINRAGDRHLSFDARSGWWHRLWEDRRPEPISAADAVRLRPSDVDLILKMTNIWIMAHHDHPRAPALTDELAGGIKSVVVHFAAQSGGG